MALDPGKLGDEIQKICDAAHGGDASATLVHWADAMSVYASGATFPPPSGASAARGAMLGALQGPTDVDNRTKIKSAIALFATTFAGACPPGPGTLPNIPPGGQPGISGWDSPTESATASTIATEIHIWFIGGTHFLGGPPPGPPGPSPTAWS
tara:strand:- start:2598 stop:3056 length:459 start_codon:yes stop_codon:yes gene_type:complete